MSGRSRRLQALALLIGAAGALAAAEAATRVFERFVTVYDLEMARYASSLKVESADPNLGHRHRPNASARLMGVRVATGSLGLRDREFAASKPPGAYRILALGDSITMGWGVRESDAYPKRLELLLNRAARARSYEVVNAGVGNYNTVQELAYLKGAGRALNPDMVLLGYFVNDAEPVPRRSGSYLLNHSHFAVLLWSRINLLLARFDTERSYRRYYAGLYADSNPGWARCRSALLELRDYCAAEKIKLLVVLLPELHDLSEPAPFDGAYEKVSRVLESASVPLVDLRPRFRGLDARGLWVGADDAHPNADAHAVIAEGVFDGLAAEGLLR